MIFSHGLDEKVLSGQKTQTRRLVQEGDEATYAVPSGEIAQVYRRGKLLWEGYKTYSIQSGRGKKGNGRFRIVKIRIETLQSITEADAKAEGVRKLYRCPQWLPNEAILSFKQLWDSIHTKPGTCWAENPEVWVLEIEAGNEK